MAYKLVLAAFIIALAGCYNGKVEKAPGDGEPHLISGSRDSAIGLRVYRVVDREMGVVCYINWNHDTISCVNVPSVQGRDDG